MIKAEKQSKAKSAWGWVLAIGIAVAAALLIRNFVFGITLVEGPSMEPTLYTNEFLAVEKVSRYFGLPERGDVIIVNYPGQTDTYVKRVVGLPGETVEVRDSTVYIDGVALEEEYTSDEPYPDSAPAVVPEDHVYVMGDNRAHSWDSRAEGTGAIPHDAILGHALAVVFPFNEIRGVS